MRSHCPFGGPTLPGFEAPEPASPVAADPAHDIARPTPARTLPFEVTVVKSRRRKSTVGAQLMNGVLTVTVPSWMGDVEVERWSAEMSNRFARKMSTESINLRTRATSLSRRFDLPRAREIVWEDMQSRWGSCTMATASIRISSRLASYPDWVLDYVIVHELAHLEVPDHSPAFWKVVDRFPKSERARGYLIAKAGDDRETD